jgi:spore coat polysaccharide biosynthesis predicted glycosyltransferase SpsG
MRSLAVAEEAQSAGMAVAMSADLTDLGWLTPWVDELAIEILPPAHDPADLARMVDQQAVSAVLLDDYDFAPARESVNDAGAILVNFEDDHYGRRPADIAIDYSLGAEATSRPDDGSPVSLRGVEFAPLRRQVTAARSVRAEQWQVVREVAGMLGGTDPLGLRPIAEDALNEVGVAVTSAFPGLGFLPRVAQADAVVCAAGSSAYEMCCLGMPFGLVQVADNQAANYHRLVAAGAATALGRAEDLIGDRAAFAERLRRWLASPAVLTTTAGAARELLDGKGAQRLAMRIASASPEYAD